MPRQSTSGWVKSAAARPEGPCFWMSQGDLSQVQPTRESSLSRRSPPSQLRCVQPAVRPASERLAWKVKLGPTRTVRKGASRSATTSSNAPVARSASPGNTRTPPKTPRSWTRAWTCGRRDWSQVRPGVTTSAAALRTRSRSAGPVPETKMFPKR